MAIKDKLAQLNKLREKAKAGGGANRIEVQHSKGKLTARERIELLFDPGTFTEIDPFVVHQCTDFGMGEKKFLGDAVVSGYGKVNGRMTFAFAQDFTVLGGSLSEMACNKVCKIMDLAASGGAPIIGILDSGGARIQEGALSLHGYGQIFYRNTLYSGTVLQISIIVGPTAGGAVYSPAIADFAFMVEGIGQMYITGPDVVKVAVAEETSLEELGGAGVNAAKSGNAHFVADSEQECFQQVRKLLSFFPQNYKEKPPRLTANGSLTCGEEELDEELLHIVPDDPRLPYDMMQIISRVVDNGDLMQVHEDFAPNLIVGFARLKGQSVGILAQQPMNRAGALDIDASDKGARFIRTCDCFNIPLVTLVDTPGYIPGTDQEHKGIIRHGAKLLFAYAEATVPKVSVIIRKAYGGAYIAMSSKSLRGDICYAWPTAEIAVMGPEEAVEIVYHNEIEKSSNPEEIKEKLIEEYRAKFTNPYPLAAKGYIDDVIDPRETRSKIIKALEMLEGKASPLSPKKHDNIPV